MILWIWIYTDGFDPNAHICQSKEEAYKYGKSILPEREYKELDNCFKIGADDCYDFEQYKLFTAEVKIKEKIK